MIQFIIFMVIVSLILRILYLEDLLKKNDIEIPHILKRGE